MSEHENKSEATGFDEGGAATATAPVKEPNFVLYSRNVSRRDCRRTECFSTMMT